MAVGDCICVAYSSATTTALCNISAWLPEEGGCAQSGRVGRSNSCIKYSNWSQVGPGTREAQTSIHVRSPSTQPFHSSTPTTTNKHTTRHHLQIDLHPKTSSGSLEAPAFCQCFLHTLSKLTAPLPVARVRFAATAVSGSSSRGAATAAGVNQQAEAAWAPLSHVTGSHTMVALYFSR